MPQDRIVIVALLANEDARRNAKKYLATVTPASFPVILLVEGQELEARDRQRLDHAQHAALLAPVASIAKGWLDELLVIVKQYPDSVVVPGSPNVNGPQRMILEEHQSVRNLKDQGPYAVNIRKHFANITQPIHYATDLVACARGSWVREALDTGGTTSREAFSTLYRDRPLLLAQGAAVFSSEVKSQLIPGAPITSPLVSLCMIVKDEEEVIADALDSALGILFLGERKFGIFIISEGRVIPLLLIALDHLFGIVISTNCWVPRSKGQNCKSLCRGGTAVEYSGL